MDGARLARRLTTTDAVVIGLGSMLGAGVFTAFAPAAAAAGAWLLGGLAVAALVAYANAVSSARLAARYPESGGTYVYGRERLGPGWGALAGWAFVVGKSASAAAMALTIGSYAWPGAERAVAVAAVLLSVALTYRGIRAGALATRVLVVLVITVLVVASAVAVLGPRPDAGAGSALEPTAPGPAGVLAAAGFLFFAFAGYARIATLGEEVRDPERTIPRAILIALAVVLGLYVLVAVSLLVALGPGRIAASPAPLAAAVAGSPWLEPVVRGAAVAAAGGSLLGLLLGVSRTTLAMARDRRLPHALAAVHPRYGVPHRADVAVGVVVTVLVLVSDLRGAITVSSVAVLIYYAVANASALTLDRSAGSRVVPVIGLVGCLTVALSLVVR